MAQFQLSRKEENVSSSYIFCANGYFFKSKLGSGSFGTVYKGEKNFENVALKEITIKEKGKEDTEVLPYEVKVMKSLDHENIVKCLDHFYHVSVDKQNWRSLFIVMELCLITLYDLYTLKRSILTTSTMKSIFKQLIKALSYIQSKEILHLDIIPDNVLLTANGVLKVGDWGLSEKLHCGKKYGKEDDVVGTMWYRAPEILLLMKPTACADVWSAGCVFAEMFRKSAPFQGDDWDDQLNAIYYHCCKEGSNQPEPFSSLTSRFIITHEMPVEDKDRLIEKLLGDVSDPALLEIITNMLTVNPRERPTASELLDEDSPFYAATLEDASDNIFTAMRVVMEILKGF